MPEDARPAGGATKLRAFDAEHFIDTYQTNAEWIRFADAKAAVVLTAAGALASVLIPTLKPYLAEEAPGVAMESVVIGAFSLWLLCVAVACIHAFRCVLPFRRKGVHPSLDHCQHFHPAAISHAYTLDQVDRFTESVYELGEESFQREILASILIDAHVSAAKYTRVSAAIRWLAGGAIFGFAYLVLIQF